MSAVCRSSLGATARRQGEACRRAPTRTSRSSRRATGNPYLTCEPPGDGAAALALSAAGAERAGEAEA